jgi:hypothetical protein
MEDFGELKRWQRSSTGMWHDKTCNGAVRRRPLYLGGERKSLNELREMQKKSKIPGYPKIQICKKCSAGR